MICDSKEMQEQLVDMLLMEDYMFLPGIWDCACGNGYISEALKAYDFTTLSTDSVLTGYSDQRDVIDFLNVDVNKVTSACDIITKPPTRHLLQYIEQAYQLMHNGGKIAFLVPYQSLNAPPRSKMLARHRPLAMYISNINATYTGSKVLENPYTWFVWQKGYTGQTHIKLVKHIEKPTITLTKEEMKQLNALIPRSGWDDEDIDEIEIIDKEDDDNNETV